MLTEYDKLWLAWQTFTKEEAKRVGVEFLTRRKATPGGEGSERELADGSGVLREGLSQVVLGDRNGQQKETAFSVPLSIRLDCMQKMDIFQSVLNTYVYDTHEDRFGKLLMELKAPGMRGFDLKLRIQRANEGKEAANKKYKDGNWFGAMYTYAVAWGCLVPYYSAALAESDPLKKEMEKLEMAIFSNITAMAVTGTSSLRVRPIVHSHVADIGRDAAMYCLSRKDIASVGIIAKSCDAYLLKSSGRRIILLPKVNYTSLNNLERIHFDKQIALLQKQAEALSGLDQSMAYRDIYPSKQILKGTQGEILIMFRMKDEAPVATEGM